MIWVNIGWRMVAISVYFKMLRPSVAISFTVCSFFNPLEIEKKNRFESVLQWWFSFVSNIHLPFKFISDIFVFYSMILGKFIVKLAHIQLVFCQSALQIIRVTIFYAVSINFLKLLRTYCYGTASMTGRYNSWPKSAVTLKKTLRFFFLVISQSTKKFVT